MKKMGCARPLPCAPPPSTSHRTPATEAVAKTEQAAPAINPGGSAGRKVKSPRRNARRRKTLPPPTAPARYFVRVSTARNEEDGVRKAIALRHRYPAVFLRFTPKLCTVSGANIPKTTGLCIGPLKNRARAVAVSKSLKTLGLSVSQVEPAARVRALPADARKLSA